jgi:uncharacterized membrane protein
MRNSKRNRNQLSQPDRQVITQNSVTIQSQWEGPLPPPQALAAFDEIVPGGAKLIMDQWKNESDHRRHLQSRALTWEIIERNGSRLLAFAFSMSGLALTAYCVANKAEWVAGFLGVGTVGTVAGALIYQKSKS